MAHIKISRGLDIPIKNKPTGEPSSLPTSPSLIALDLKIFEDVKFKILAKVGDVVKIGQPIVEDKSIPGRMFCSPAGGIIKEIRRGYRRVLVDVIIEVSPKEEYFEWAPMAVDTATRDQLISRLKEGGLFAHIRSRPFDLLANPSAMPRSIFVKAIESAPFAPPADMQVKGHEEAFQTGLNVLSKLTDGPVHLIHAKHSPAVFSEAKNVCLHIAEGPHPIGNPSVHIEHIDPIRSASDVLWTVNVHDVIAIGTLFASNRYFIERVISIAGPGVLPDRVGYFYARAGIPISELISGRLTKKGPLRLISGDPLIGHKVEAQDFLGFSDTVFCVVPENTSREFLHFFKLGINKYSFSRAYVSGHLDNTDREYDFTTSLHGEHRAFVDPTLYDKVMPLPISTMTLVKAVLSEDFELAEKLGLLTVVSEDFGLPTFVCPSKMEMVDIIKAGLKRYAHDVS